MSLGKMLYFEFNTSLSPLFSEKALQAWHEMPQQYWANPGKT